MKKLRYYALLAALVFSAAAVGVLGHYLKTQILAPYGLHQEESIFSIPFLFPETAKIMDISLRQTQPTEPPTEATAAPTEPNKKLPREFTVEDPPDTPTMPPPPPPVYGEDESYFDDALFIGDSRTVGLRDMARLGHADYFCKVGMTIYTMFQEGAADENFSYQKLETLLEEKQYGKIYICLGLNEAGYALDSIESKYAGAIERVRELQPGAIIVIHSVMSVSRGKAASSASFRLERLQAINEMLRGFADNETVFFVDVNAVMADEEGYLPDDYSKDGCHLYGKYYEMWAKFLCDSAILPD